jgi:hypothetical protein
MLIEVVVADWVAADVATRVPAIERNTMAEGTEVGTSHRQQPREGIEAFHRMATIAIAHTSAGTTIAYSTAATASSVGTEGLVLPSWVASPG